SERTDGWNLWREHHFVQLAEVVLGGDERHPLLFIVDRPARLRHDDGVVVDEELIVDHRNAVAGNGDDAFDETYSIDRREEHDDVAALRVIPFPELDRGEGNFEVIGELVDDDAIAFLNGRLHRAGRHIIPVGQRRTQ